MSFIYDVPRGNVLLGVLRPVFLWEEAEDLLTERARISRNFEGIFVHYEKSNGEVVLQFLLAVPDDNGTERVNLMKAGFMIPQENSKGLTSRYNLIFDKESTKPSELFSSLHAKCQTLACVQTFTGIDTRSWFEHRVVRHSVGERFQIKSCCNVM